MNLQLAGKKALIIGGSRGIGKAVARLLVQEGVDCVIISGNETELKETARELYRVTGSSLYPVPGSKIYPVIADTTDPDSILNLIEKAAELLGGIDILVNSGDFVSLNEPENFEEKLISYSHCIQAVAPYMMKNNWGRIINVSSMFAPYVESIKASARNLDVIELTRSSSVELGRYGITVNAVYPGDTETDTTNEDIANVITFLSSPLSVSITGDVIDVSGGSSKTLQYQINI